MKLEKPIDKLRNMRYGDPLGEGCTFLAFSMDGTSVYLAEMIPSELFGLNSVYFRSEIRCTKASTALKIMQS